MRWEATGRLRPPAWTMRGVKNRLTAPYFPSVWFSNTYDAEMAAESLKREKAAKQAFWARVAYPSPL